MQTINLLFENSAVDFALKYLKRNNNYTWDNIEYINQNRYAIVHGKPPIAIIFKKDWFYKFGEICKDKGIGDTINCEDLRLLKNRNVQHIYIVHKSGKIYRIDIMDFLIKSIRWMNKEGKEVRSISIHEYERVDNAK